jgi:2',3'-cyclic-nucleotide 2'-phosphodiesterase (5'-nucleotidase family)
MLNKLCALVVCLGCAVPLVAAPVKATFRLLLFSDLVALAEDGKLEDLARLATAIKERQAAAESVLVLTGGYWPGAWEDGPTPEAMANFLTYLSSSIAVLGESELTADLAGLKPFLKRAGVRVVTSNMIDSNGNSFFYPYRVMRSNEVKVTFMGVSPRDKEQYHHFTLRDPTSTVRGYCNVLGRLRGGIGFTVALAHLSAHQADRLSADVPGVDLVVCADGNSINAVRDNAREPGKTGRRLVLALGGDKPGLVEIELAVRRFDPKDWDITDYSWQEVEWRKEKVDQEALKILRGELESSDGQDQDLADD